MHATRITRPGATTNVATNTIKASRPATVNSSERIQQAIAPPIVHEVIRSEGRPLDDHSRAVMESRFGHDFSAIRIHTDSQAVQSTRAVRATAFTVGRD